jgi:SAM-dependent methyltransferase
MGKRIDALRAIRTANIGTEVSSKAAINDDAVDVITSRMGTIECLTTRHRGMLAQYVADLNRMVAEIARVLRPGGRAIFVVGDSTLRGIFVRNSEAIKSLARRHDLSLEHSRKRSLPDHKRYLPPPSSAAGNSLHGRMREEVVIEFRR